MIALVSMPRASRTELGHVRVRERDSEAVDPNDKRRPNRPARMRTTKPGVTWFHLENRNGVGAVRVVRRKRAPPVLSGNEAS